MNFYLSTSFRGKTFRHVLPFLPIWFRFSAALIVVCTLALPTQAGENRSTPEQAHKIGPNLTDPSHPLVKVNQQLLHYSDLAALAAVEGVPPEAIQTRSEELVDVLIQRTLVGQFLSTQNVPAPQGTLDRFLGVMKQRAGSQEQWDALLKQLGTTQTQLLEQYTIKVQWLRYIEQHTPDSELLKFYQSRKSYFDGTKVTARQIFLPKQMLEPEAIGQLQQVREKIVSGELSFEAAAQKYSKAPSAASGGLLGTFPHQGRMPLEMTDACFALKQGEVSRPVKTSFGYHLFTVDQIEPGQFSFEDVRRELLAQLAKSEWQGTVSRLKRVADIEQF